MQGIVQKIIDLFGSGIGKEIAVFVISMLPILELRGGLLAASIIGMDFIPAYIISILGNCLPIPFVLIFLDKIFNWLRSLRLLKRLLLSWKKRYYLKKHKLKSMDIWDYYYLLEFHFLVLVLGQEQDLQYS